MIGEHTAEGFELRLRARGAGRYATAAFLGVWLCGWVVGEVVAVGALLWGAYSLFTGRPPAAGRRMLDAGAAIGGGVFLLAWLALWTAGGVAAIRELLAQLAGDDRVVAEPGGLAVTRCRGPFRSTRRIPRDQLRGVRLHGRDGALVADTARAVVTLSRLGTRDERLEGAEALRRELGLPTDTAAATGAALPDGWEEVVTPEGERVLVTSARRRRQQAVVGIIVAVAAALIPISIAWRLLAELPFPLLAALAIAIAAGLGWLAARLASGRTEWRIGSGRITQRRRRGASVRDVFEAHRLELDTTRDSDGDEWFNLDAVAADEPPAAPGLRVSRRTRRRVFSTMRDPEVPRRLGLWLAARAEVPFDDRATTERRSQDMAALRAQLERSGRMGKLVARLLARVESGPGPPEPRS